MTKTRDLADLGGGFIQAGTGAVQRTVESKLQDVVSVKDFGAVGDGVADDTAAIQAALTSLGTNGTLIFDGRFKVTSSLVKTGIEYLEIKGSQDSLIVPSGNINVFDLTLADSQRKIVLRDLAIYPVGAAQVNSIFKITGQSVASSAYSNLVASNITCNNLNGGTGTSNTAKSLFDLKDIWAARITDCVFFAPSLQPAVAGTSFVVTDAVIDMTLSNCIIHFGDSLIYQKSYCEGFNATGCTVVGSNYAVNQLPGTWSGLAGRKLYQIQFSHCELNTFTGSFLIDNCVNLKTINCAHTRNGNNPWTAYNITNCNYSSFVSDLFIGGGGVATTRVAISIGGTSTNNTWNNPNFWDVDTIASIGSSCNSTVISSGLSTAVNPVSLVTDLGTRSLLDISGRRWGLPIKYSRNGNYINSTAGYHELQNNVNTEAVAYFNHDGTALTDTIIGALTASTASTNWSFLNGWSGGFTDKEFNLRGDGNGFCDGAWTGGGADYAEYFEWSDGNPNGDDRRGISVVLDGNKIRPAVAGEDPIGVISGNPSIVGDSAWNKWSGKYLRDVYGSYILDANNNRRLNPDYNPNATYIPREERPEWGCVGLLGKLRISKGQPVSPSWVKMQDVTDQVEEWLVK